MTHSLDSHDQHLIIHCVDDAVIAHSDAEPIVATVKFPAHSSRRIFTPEQV